VSDTLKHGPCHVTARKPRAGGPPVELNKASEGLIRVCCFSRKWSFPSRR
jgi:hypothetical protein